MMAEENQTNNDNPYKVPEAALSSSDVHAPEGKMYTQAMIEHLKDTKPWVRFLSVLGFIGIGAMVVGSISIIAFGTRSEASTFYPMAVAGFMYLVFAGIYVIPVMFLNKYASSINELLLTGETRAMEQALRYQKSFWKFMGIATIIGFALGIIIAIGIVVAFVIGFASNTGSFNL